MMNPASARARRAVRVRCSREPMAFPHIDEAFVGDEIGRRAFLQFALATICGEIAALEGAIASGEFPEVARQAHALKGGFAGLDATACTTAAQGLVIAAASADHGRVMSAWGALYRRYVCFRWMVNSCLAS